MQTKMETFIYECRRALTLKITFTFLKLCQNCW